MCQIMVFNLATDISSNLTALVNFITDLFMLVSYSEETEKHVTLTPYWLSLKVWSFWGIQDRVKRDEKYTGKAEVKVEEESSGGKREGEKTGRQNL